jgi:Peptidase family S41
MKIRTLAYTFLLIFLVMCNSDEPSSEIVDDGSSSLSPVLLRYLSDIVNRMQANSINRYKIDWKDFRSRVYKKAVGAKTISDVFPGVEEALTLLGDNHSSLFWVDGRVSFEGTLKCEAESRGIVNVPADVGYIYVGGFFGSGNKNDAIAFADRIQKEIREQDSIGLRGWIVDLRGNTGGNMWPMLAGVAPILGEGICGYFVDADGNESSWGVLNGSAVSGNFSVTSISNPYTLLSQNPKVAVLLDNAVSSSGEMIAIAFAGRAKTRSFGYSTCGMSTANTPFVLSDNATLFLTTHNVADRTKKIYGIPINPDVGPVSESLVEDAVTWIKEL